VSQVGHRDRLTTGSRSQGSNPGFRGQRNRCIRMLSLGLYARLGYLLMAGRRGIYLF
jgi:hypothetical protein